jgi:two-component system chemotaxis response regulator CheB
MRGGQLTIRALELGAFDFIPKPDAGSAQENLIQLRECVAPVLRAFRRKFEVQSLLASKDAKSPAIPKAATLPQGLPPQSPLTPATFSQKRTGSPIVLIGVSTGGPNALAKVLPELPANLGAPVFIVQHMPPLFTQALAERLNGSCAIRVKEGENGEIAVNNSAYIAPGGKQMRLAPGPNGEIVIQLTDDPPECDCRPAADYLFRSAALKFPGRSIAAVLTGMGKDGTQGLRLLKRHACFSIAQDEASCVVFGMPREAILAGVVDVVVPLEKVAASIVRSIAGVQA